MLKKGFLGCDSLIESETRFPSKFYSSLIFNASSCLFFFIIPLKSFSEVLSSAVVLNRFDWICSHLRDVNCLVGGKPPFQFHFCTHVVSSSFSFFIPCCLIIIFGQVLHDQEKSRELFDETREEHHEIMAHLIRPTVRLAIPEKECMSFPEVNMRADILLSYL